MKYRLAIFFLIFVFVPVVTKADFRFNSGWTTAVRVTVEEEQIDAALSNFPVFVDLSTLPAAFFNNAQSNGADIRATTDITGAWAELPIQIESFNKTARTGSAFFRAGSLSASADTVFYLHSGNAATSSLAATDANGSRNVWTQMTQVYHANESSGNLADSTATGGTMTASGGIVYSHASKAGTAVQLNGTTGYFSGGSIPTGSEGTISMMVSSTNDSSDVIWSGTDKDAGVYYLYTGIGDGQTGTLTNELIMTAQRNNDTGNIIGHTSTTRAGLFDGNQHHLAIASSGTLWGIYMDGIELGITIGQSTNNGDWFSDTTGVDTFLIGALNLSGSLSGYLAGTVDEFRVYSSGQTFPWIKAEAKNLTSHNTFNTIGTAQATDGTPMVITTF